jgi:nucleotide-binding universal stress UspA family protein
MRILICSDGTDPADKPTKLGGLIAGPCHAETTLLGIAEKPEHKEPLRRALETEAELLRNFGLTPEIVMREGDPIHQIFNQAAEGKYEIAVIGARRKRGSDLYCYSQRTYEVVKAVPAAVLIAIEDCAQLKRILVCTGGKHYIEDAVQLTGDIAKCTGASVTLLHVMAEPPAMYADLVRLEEDVARLLDSDSELGINLRGQKKSLEKIEVPAEVRVRHGIALDEIFAEVEEGSHDMIVVGSPLARGPLRHYIMGDLTRSILNRANCPVLVARAGKAAAIAPGFWNSLKRIFVAP